MSVQVRLFVSYCPFKVAKMVRSKIKALAVFISIRNEIIIRNKENLVFH
jgi:hypothetical protein